jgi:hypothetical protein
MRGKRNTREEDGRGTEGGRGRAEHEQIVDRESTERHDRTPHCTRLRRKKSLTTPLPPEEIRCAHEIPTLYVGGRGLTRGGLNTTKPHPHPHPHTSKREREQAKRGRRRRRNRARTRLPNEHLFPDSCYVCDSLRVSFEKHHLPSGATLREHFDCFFGTLMLCCSMLCKTKNRRYAERKPLARPALFFASVSEKPNNPHTDRHTD